jgi:hypothetical protein
VLQRLPPIKGSGCCAALHYGCKDTVADEIVATKIIELAKAGETNPDLLCEETLNYFQQHL